MGTEFSYCRFGESGRNTFDLAGVGAVFLSDESSGPYLLGATNAFFDTGEATLFSVAAGLGTLMRIGPAFVVRAEARYRRWLSRQTNRPDLSHLPVHVDYSQDFPGADHCMLPLWIGTRIGGNAFNAEHGWNPLGARAIRIPPARTKPRH